MNALEQTRFPWDAQGERKPEAPKPPMLKRSRLPWRKQWNLFDPPDPQDLRSYLARPLSLFNGRELGAFEVAFKAQADAILDEFADDRPKTWADCQPGGINAQRPCPYVSCAHHTYTDVDPETGALKLNWPGMELDDPRIKYTCALDAADAQAAKGPKAPPRDFVALGRLLNMTGTGAKKIIRRAEERAKAGAEAAGLEPSYDDGPMDRDAMMPPPAGNLRGVFDAIREAPEPDPIHRQLQKGRTT